MGCDIIIIISGVVLIIIVVGVVSSIIKWGEEKTIKRV